MSTAQDSVSHQHGAVVKPNNDECLMTEDGVSISQVEVPDESVIYRCEDCGELHYASPTWPQPGRVSTWVGRLFIAGVLAIISIGVAAGFIIQALAAAIGLMSLPVGTIVATRIAGAFTREFRQLQRMEQTLLLIALCFSALPGFVIIHALPERLRGRIPLTELTPASRAVFLNPTNFA
jgi:hypothetical protein